VSAVSIGLDRTGGLNIFAGDSLGVIRGNTLAFPSHPRLLLQSFRLASVSLLKDTFVGIKLPHFGVGDALELPLSISGLELAPNGEFIGVVGDKPILFLVKIPKRILPLLFEQLRLRLQFPISSSRGNDCGGGSDYVARSNGFQSAMHWSFSFSFFVFFPLIAFAIL